MKIAAPPSRFSDLLDIDPDLIRHFGDPGADYRLYPETNYFVEAFDAQTYLAWLDHRNTNHFRRPLSLNIHIPYCHTLCSYCQFHQIVADGPESANAYLQFLSREIAHQSQLFKDDTKVEQVYFDGGTPTFLTDRQLDDIVSALRRHFNLAEAVELSIALDPRQFQHRSLQGFRQMGFNCAIIEVQDFDPQVQQAIQRIQSQELTLQTIYTVQQTGFKSIRIELRYGLPKQNLEKFANTLNHIIAANPNQIKLLSFQHQPQKFKAQRNIDTRDLPDVETQFSMRLLAISCLTQAGYVHIGMNLFAKLDDPLANAQRQGRLHYSLQSYSIHPDCDYLALGVSAIGSIGPTLYQNHCDLLQYYDKLEQGTPPVMRGLELSADDLIRRSVMHALICHAVISYESVETFFPIDFQHYFATELSDLIIYEQAGLVTISQEEINVTPKGQLFINGICKIFDKYDRAHQHRKSRLSLM